MSKTKRRVLQRLESRELLAAIVVQHTDGDTIVSELGLTDTILVALDAAPATQVVLQLSSSDISEVTVAPAELTFTSNNWNLPQMVTATGIDDDMLDGLQLANLIASVDVANSDASYANTVDAILQIKNEDDHEIRTLAGTFVAAVENQKDIADSSNRYVPPTTPLDLPNGESELEQFAELATWFRAGDFALTAPRADQLNYELVKLANSPSIFGLVEKLDVDQKQTKGWGSYFWNFAATSEALLEVPHPIHDTRTWEVAAIAYTRANNTGFMMAGANRNTGPNGTVVTNNADVAHLENSIFQEVHKAWSSPTADVWQIHGFDLEKRPNNWPQETDVVLSTGEDRNLGHISPQLVSLENRLENAGWETYAYAQGHRREFCLNGDQPGSRFEDLAATTNRQGGYTRGLQAEFVHVELEQSVRLDGPPNRLLTGNLIGDEIASDHRMVEVLLPDYEVPEASAELIGQISRFGDDTQPLTISLNSSAPLVASVPIQATVSANQNLANFTVSLHDDNVVEDDEQVVIAIDHATYATCAAVLTVQDDDTPVLQVLNVQLNSGIADPPDLPKGAQPSSWATQRSDLSNVQITFNHAITATENDVVLTNLGISPADEDIDVDLTAAIQVSGSLLTLQLNNNLSDGVYRLELLPTLTSAGGLFLDGDSNGVGGDSFIFAGDASNDFYRLSADWSGDEGVSVFDFSSFSYWFGTPIPTAPSYMDLNGDNGVSVFDFTAFSNNFGVGVTFGATFTRANTAAESRPSLEFERLVEFAEANRKESGTLLSASSTLAARDELIRVFRRDLLPNVAGRKRCGSDTIGTPKVPADIAGDKSYFGVRFIKLLNDFPRP